MPAQAQHGITVHFLDGSQRPCVRTGNNAAWHCVCGRATALIGYSDAVVSTDPNSLIICPEGGCDRRYRVVAPGLKKVPTPVQEVLS